MTVLSSMLAVDFAFTTAPGAAHDLVITEGANTYDVDIASGTYRMFIASSSKDFLAVLNAAIAVALAGSGKTCVLSLLADGRVLATCSVAMTLTPSTDVQELLGHLHGTGFAVVSSWHPRHCIFTHNLAGGSWKPSTPGGFERTAGGRVYGFSAGLTSYDRELQAMYVPRTSAEASVFGVTATPYYPSEGYMSLLNPSSATSRPWSWLDVLAQAPNAEAALALGNLQELVAEQPAGPYLQRYFQGYVRAEDLMEPQVELSIPTWESYLTARLGFVLPTASSSGTRA